MAQSPLSSGSKRLTTTLDLREELSTTNNNNRPGWPSSDSPLLPPSTTTNGNWDLSSPSSGFSSNRSSLSPFGLVQQSPISERNGFKDGFTPNHSCLSPNSLNGNAKQSQSVSPALKSPVFTFNPNAEVFDHSRKGKPLSPPVSNMNGGGSPKTKLPTVPCICNRPRGVVYCKRCGFEMVGRKMTTCDAHQNRQALMDIQTCPKCRATENSLKEVAQNECEYEDEQ